ncbi:MAG TPA: proton-conducting transporter membrane subunit, partial [Pseudogracilibacillus sp.]|nr:proton-conducting transporter membrane subunit [Pseudogracilibacillus sp.]
MSNLAVMPIVFPLFAGIILVFLNRKTNIVRQLSRVFAFVNLCIVIYTSYLVFTEGTIILETGTWMAPYGIIFVADSFAILIVLATSIIAMVIALIAPRLVPERKEKYFFYAFFFFLISGVSGAFLTGDLFNLFVFFEVLLMASYGLIVLGGNKRQLRESFKYLLFNLFSSVVFVTTVSFLYAVVGTVNMAHIAQRVHEVNEQGILTVIGIVLFFVFAT